MAKLVTIAAFHDPIQAHLSRMRLETNGITSFLADEYIVSIQPFYSSAVGGVRLQVRDTDVTRALEILNEEPLRLVK